MRSAARHENTDRWEPRAEVWRFILKRLERRQPVALLLVADSKGSAPGRPGFKMAVAANGRLCGTVGGGAIERDTVEEARALLRQARPGARVALKVHLPWHPQTSGMICGGRQTTVLYPCRAADQRAVAALLAALAAGRPGRLGLSAGGLRFTLGRGRGPARRFTQRGTRWNYTERIAEPDTVFIVGGGHVALALSRVLATLDVRIVVFDERGDVNKFTRNRYAHERRVLPFDQVGRYIPPGPRSYAVIMTPGHRSDDVALRQLVRKRLAYLGVLGSLRKARELLGHLRNEGCPAHCLARVRVPVGLPIASHTPAEIAISIAAQIIQVRNTASPMPAR